MRIKPNLFARAQARDPDCIPELLQLITDAALDILKLECNHPAIIAIEKARLTELGYVHRELEKENDPADSKFVVSSTFIGWK